MAIFSSDGAPSLAADVAGWFTDSSNPTAPGARFTAASQPLRICDTRGSQAANPCTGKTLHAGTDLHVTVGGNDGVPKGATAVVLNVTATDGASSGYMTLSPAGEAPPLASDLNFTEGESVANMTIATLGTEGAFSVSISANSADVIVDLVGWYS